MKSNPDTEHLRLLSVFHFVVAGMIGLVSMFPLLHVVMGIAIVSGLLGDADRGQAPPAVLGWLFIVFPGMIILCGLALASVVAVAGWRIRAHTGYMYCLVIAGIECIFMPFGTVLGVLTIIVLMRPTVRDLFEIEDTGKR
jgi:hypothetical protein